MKRGMAEVGIRLLQYFDSMAGVSKWRARGTIAAMTTHDRDRDAGWAPRTPGHASQAAAAMPEIGSVGAKRAASKS